MDRLTAERFGIPVEWLMEAAGWQVARLCNAPAVVACGTGNNGGDGLAAARHLHRWGLLAGVACIDRASLTGAAAAEARALEGLAVPISSELDFQGAQLVVDALLGTGLSRPPQGLYAAWITAMNASGLGVISVDLPSGLEADTGKAHDPTVRAARTVTLGLPKPGLVEGDGPTYAGEVWVADIGVPFEAYAEIGISVPARLYSTADRLRLESAEA